MTPAAILFLQGRMSPFAAQLFSAGARALRAFSAAALSPCPFSLQGAFCLQESSLGLSPLALPPLGIPPLEFSVSLAFPPPLQREFPPLLQGLPLPPPIFSFSSAF